MCARYEPSKRKEDTPAVCPLINTCDQRKTDLEEYARLKRKWTAYAKKQASEELEIETKGKKEKYSVDWAQEVTGTQVFHLEYMPTENMSPQQKQALAKEKAERFNQMCPHFKREVLGMTTGTPPYLECHIFSKWFYEKKE